MNFEKKRVLDIGGGLIVFSSFYAASRGASDVTCLEPEIDGTQIQLNSGEN